MHHCDVVGIEAPPAQEVVEQYHRRPRYTFTVRAD